MEEDISIKNTNELLEEANNAVKSNVAGCVNLFTKIRWRHVSFTINNEPKPSQRPRTSGNHIYVPGAYKNTAFFHKYVLPTLGDLWINTPCKTKIDIYVKTPASFTKTQKILAEMKILRPWTRAGDIDNFEKTCLDSLVGNKKRGHNGIMSDDCIVVDMESHKYYSTAPRYEIKISYMGKIPIDLKKILKIEEQPRDGEA